MTKEEYKKAKETVEKYYWLDMRRNDLESLYSHLTEGSGFISIAFGDDVKIIFEKESCETWFQILYGLEQDISKITMQLNELNIEGE